MLRGKNMKWFETVKVSSTWKINLWLVSDIHSSLLITKFRRTPSKNESHLVDFRKVIPIIIFWRNKIKVCSPLYNKGDFFGKWSQANLSDT